jgi:hypothetical protein
MKHLLNNLSEEEKNSIREQHTDRIKIDTSRFKSLMESKLGDVKPISESIILNEMEPEPVHAGFAKRGSYAFDEGKANMRPETRKRLTDSIKSYLEIMKDTIERFIDSKYKLPTIFEINVGTSHSGSPEQNANVARMRKKLLVDIITDAFRQLGIRADKIEQLVTMQVSDYQPSEFNFNFYDAQKVKPNDKERFGTIIMTPIETRGLDPRQLASSSRNVQSPNKTVQVKRSKDFIDTILDYIGLGEDKYDTYSVPDEDKIIFGIKRLQTFSDLEQLNQEIYNATRLGLGTYLTRKKLESDTYAEICNHLKNVVATRPGKSQYQVDCGGNGIRIEGLRTF